MDLNKIRHRSDDSHDRSVGSGYAGVLNLVGAGLVPAQQAETPLAIERGFVFDSMNLLLWVHFHVGLTFVDSGNTR